MDSDNYIGYNGGFHVTIGFLKKGPYDYNCISRIFHKIIELGGLPVSKAAFKKFQSNKTNYEVYMSGDAFDVEINQIEENLAKNLFLDTEFSYPLGGKRYWLRFRVSIRSDNSIAIYLHLAYEDLLGDYVDPIIAKSNLEIIKQLAFEINKIEKFTYGLIETEGDIWEMSVLMKDKPPYRMPGDWAFYGPDLLETFGKEHVLSLLEKAVEFKYFENGSVFFRWGDYEEPPQNKKEYQEFEVYMLNYIKKNSKSDVQDISKLKRTLRGCSFMNFLFSRSKRGLN